MKNIFHSSIFISIFVFNLFFLTFIHSAEFLSLILYRFFFIYLFGLVYSGSIFIIENSQPIGVLPHCYTFCYFWHGKSSLNRQDLPFTNLNIQGPHPRVISLSRLLYQCRRAVFFRSCSHAKARWKQWSFLMSLRDISQVARERHTPATFFFYPRDWHKRACVF